MQYMLIPLLNKLDGQNAHQKIRINQDGMGSSCVIVGIIHI